MRTEKSAGLWLVIIIFGIGLFMWLQPLPDAPDEHATAREIADFNAELKTIEKVIRAGVILMLLSLLSGVLVAAWESTVPPHLHSPQALEASKNRVMINRLSDRSPYSIAAIPKILLQEPLKVTIKPAPMPRTDRDPTLMMLLYFCIALIIGTSIFLYFIWFK